MLVENALSIIRSESTAMQKQLMTENKSATEFPKIKSATEFPKIRTAAVSSAAASDARSYEICNDWSTMSFSSCATEMIMEMNNEKPKPILRI